MYLNTQQHPIDCVSKFKLASYSWNYIILTLDYMPRLNTALKQK